MSARRKLTRKIRPCASAAGLPAVLETLRYAVEQPGIFRGVKALLDVNRPGGFDCPGCAWPDNQAEGKRFDFCENGAKAVADETTRRCIDSSFFLGGRSTTWRAGRVNG